jgi:iron(III) transport system substrate-binding protein
MEFGVLDTLTELANSFINPRKRLFLGYLIAALLIAITLSAVVVRLPLRDILPSLFSRAVWWSRSARSDYSVMILNQGLMLGLAPRLLSSLTVATALFEMLHIWFDGRPNLAPSAPGWFIASVFTLTLFIMDDALKYLVHRALHRWPILWCFHKVHHSAETLTPLTVHRTHPVEGVIFALRSVLVQAVMVAGFIFFFGSRAELMTVLGANVILVAFNIAGSNLRHSHVWLSYGSRIERILISPAQHQIHHSRAPHHHDRNFGAVLAIWDWIGGSLYLAGKRQMLSFGVQAPTHRSHRLGTLYILPFVEATRLCWAVIRKGTVGMSNAFFMRLVGRRTIVSLLMALSALAAFLGEARAAETLNIYSHRQPFLIKPFIDAYTAKTGTKINIVYASRGLAQRLQAEGARSPADIILTVDIGRLHVYADKDLLAPVESDILSANIPEHLRDPGGRWFGLSTRVRVIAVAVKAEDAEQITRYEDLADPMWRGRICSRPGSHVYNRALVASIIHADGIENADVWAKGVVENLARRPQGNDRAQVKAIYEGVCDISLINNYYLGKLINSDDEAHREWAASVKLIFPNQSDRGAHVNISGGGVAKHSKHKAEAIHFLEYLTEAEAQALYGSINFEYPVNPSVEAPAELKAMGAFIAETTPIARIAELAPEAQKVINRARW